MTIKYRIIFHGKTLITCDHLLNQIKILHTTKLTKKLFSIDGGGIWQIKSHTEGGGHTANITKFKDQRTLKASNNTLTLASTSS